MSPIDFNSSIDSNYDSMDPSDPNSIMYDPALAEQDGSVSVSASGQVASTLVSAVSNDSDTDPNLPSLSSDLNASAAQNVLPTANDDNDFAKKMRRFGKLG